MYCKKNWTEGTKSTVQKWMGILSICRKAGKLEMGLAPTKDALTQSRACCVLVAQDASEKTRKEACFFSSNANVPLLDLPFTKLEMAQCVGRASGVFAVCDRGFTKRMQELAEAMQQEQE